MRSFPGCYRFLVDGPVIARRNREDGTKEYLLYDDAAGDALTRVLRWKLRQAGFDGNHLDAMVPFDRTYQNVHQAGRDQGHQA